MSIGPPALSNILVQRLDAVLGTSMAAYANLVNGARPDAVSPPGETDKNPLLDENGQPIADADGGGSAQQIADAKVATALSLAARGLVTSTELTASAPTTLGATARTILALLAQAPDKAAPSQGKTPLWGALEDEDDAQAGSPGQASGTAPPAGQAAQQTVNSAGQQAEQQSEDAQQGQASQAGTAQAGGAQNRPAQASTPLTAGQATAAQAASTAGPQAAQLIQALRAALQQTGLFYESHLTELAFGQRTAQQLADEPQAQLDQDAVITRDTPQQANASSTPAPAQSNASWGSSQSTAGGLPGSSSNSSATLTLSSSLAGDNSNPLAGIHPDAAPLVRQQLDVLANQVIVWQGEAWPGTHMEWEVARDRTQGGELMDESHWATRLEIQLPRLGLVQARLNLSGNQVVMSLVAPSSATELSQNGNTLRQRFSSAGLALSQLTVDTQPPSPFEPS